MDGQICCNGFWQNQDYHSTPWWCASEETGPVERKALLTMNELSRDGLRVQYVALRKDHLFLLTAPNNSDQKKLHSYFTNNNATSKTFPHQRRPKQPSYRRNPYKFPKVSVLDLVSSLRSISSTGSGPAGCERRAGGSYSVRTSFP